MTEERWLPVVGFEGQYEVSDQGRVRSLPHLVRVVARGTEAKRLSPGRMLRPGKMNRGHLGVVIGRGNTKQVHQLVMEAFVGPRPSKKELGGTVDILHLNGNPADNRLVNLRYGTRAENIRQDYERGVRFLPKEQLAKMVKGHWGKKKCI